jgi:acetyl/propionyl-CoA carboxylase alpha subunit
MNRNPGRLRPIYPVGTESFSCHVAEDNGRFTFHLDVGDEGELPHARTLQIEVAQADEGLCRTESGRICPFAWAWVGPQLHLWLAGDLFIFQQEDARRTGSGPDAEAPGDVLAPMPGAVLEILVSEGDRVERNRTVLLLESMKMELAVTAPRNAIVRRIAVRPGQQVERGMRLLELAPEDDAPEDDAE